MARSSTTTIYADEAAGAGPPDRPYRGVTLSVLGQLPVVVSKEERTIRVGLRDLAGQRLGLTLVGVRPR